jgi:hypothetical protein
MSMSRSVYALQRFVFLHNIVAIIRQRILVFFGRRGMGSILAFCNVLWAMYTVEHTASAEN